jgi:hypothetical protein
MGRLFVNSLFLHQEMPMASTDRTLRPARVQTRLALEPLEDRTVPTNFTVTNLNDGGSGSLRLAITLANAAADEDIINFAPGLSGTINLTLPGAGGFEDDTNVSGDLDILNPLTIQGPGANVLTVRQTVANERVFHVMSAAGTSVSISGLTISGGNGNNGGGAGVDLQTAASLTLSAVEVTGNSTSGAAGSGVSTLLAGSILTIMDSTIANNSSASFGGGVLIFRGSATITNSTISGNSAGPGQPGGGVDLEGGSAVIRNSTITGNSSPIAGGGITVFGSATVTLSSTIVAGNIGGDISGPVDTTSDHNLIGNNAGSAGISNGFNGNIVGNAVTPIDPLLGPLQLNGGPTRTHALLAGSQALNNGSNAAGLPSDGRGAPFLRLFGAGVDIGALEVQPNPPPTAQAFQAARDAITALQPSGARLAAFAIGDVSGDFVSDIVLAFRLRSNKLLIATFDGIDGHIRGAFQPFRNAVGANARVQLVTLNLNADPALEIGLIVTPASLGVPHISAFTVTGTRIL